MAISDEDPNFNPGEAEFDALARVLGHVGGSTVVIGVPRRSGWPATVDRSGTLVGPMSREEFSVTVADL